MRAPIAWALAGVTLVLVVLDVVVSAQAVALTSETAVAVHGFPFVHGAVAGSALMGALIISKYERHAIGWLLSVVGCVGAVSLVTESYAYWVQEADGPGSGSLGGISAWISSLLGGQLVIAGLALMFLLSPDGHLLSPRWRYAAWATGLGALLCFLAVLSMDPTEYRLLTAEEGIGAIRRVMLSGGFLAISCALVASVVSMLKRLRRSSGEQRQQLRLIALSASLPAFGILWLFVVQSLNGDEQTWLASLPLIIAYFLLPILFAIAVLRHRLYELEVIINRTVVLAAATAFATVGYTTLVVAVGQQAGGFWFSLLVTAFVAVAFQPVRRHVVRLANRLAYGSRAQPYEELADFSSRLVGTPSASELLPAVAAAAGQALAATAATATLGTESAVWSPAFAGRAGTRAPGRGAVSRPLATDPHNVRVGEDLGTIEVSIPRGRGLRASDERLLHALADQAAVAFRNVAMEAQLAKHVKALDRTTLELAHSRARVIEADDAVRRDLEEAISRDVLPHLLAVAEGLRSGGEIEQLIQEVNTGLEALRELTRGVFPMQLTRAGLESALRSLPTSISLDPALEGRRFAARVEAAIYFCCAKASSAELSLEGAHLLLTVHGATDNLADVVDRIEAAGGAAQIDDQGISVRVPAVEAQASVSRSGPNVAFAT
jgi:hypothetical protein